MVKHSLLRTEVPGEHRPHSSGRAPLPHTLCYTATTFLDVQSSEERSFFLLRMRLVWAQCRCVSGVRGRDALTSMSIRGLVQTWAQVSCSSFLCAHTGCVLEGPCCCPQAAKFSKKHQLHTFLLAAVWMLPVSYGRSLEDKRLRPHESKAFI